MADLHAWLIDPYAKNIREVFIGDFNYRHIYAQLSGPEKKVETFDAVRLNAEGDVCYVDDEGLLTNPTHFFRFVGQGLNPKAPPLAGRGLILGTDREGESTTPQAINADWLRDHVKFMDLMEVRVRAMLGEFE